jgi:hypothetical protein
VGYGSSATALMGLLQMVRPMPGSMMMIRETKKLATTASFVTIKPAGLWSFFLLLIHV